jgi:2-deoxy-D-gluconate 3-dehydrogenase
MGMTTDRFSLAGKVAIVTGCGTGLGQGIAEGLAEAGADIVGVYRTDASETMRRVQALGRRFQGAQANLATTAAIPGIMDAALSAFGRIDILVNNAGTLRRGEAIRFSERDWDDVVDLNLKSVFFLSQAAARHWIERGAGGRIINIASVLSFQGGIRVASYTASKSGILGITRLLANEWAVNGITVNAIAPGYMSTDLTSPLREDETRNREILARIPAGRWGTPDDLKGAVIFLASDASSYVTGSFIAVDGGWLAR